MLTLHTGYRRETLSKRYTHTHTDARIPHEEGTTVDPILQTNKLKHTEFKSAQCSHFLNGSNGMRTQGINHYAMMPRFGNDSN